MPSSEVDVVVVGAGIAGLAAATELTARGVTVAVFERRPETGGRLRSVPHSAGGMVDLGATWFWPGERRVERLVASLGIATHAQYLDGDALFHQPGTAQRIAGNPIDVPSGRFSNGAQSLTHALADRLPQGVVRTDSTVTAIDASAATPSVTASNSHGEITTTSARHVVLALPPSLAAASIDFLPDLPADLARVVTEIPVWMGAVTKVVVEFAEPFWRAQGLAGSAISHLGPIRELHDMSGPDGSPAALFGFVPATSALQPAPTIDAIVHQLDELFGTDASTPTNVIVHDWRAEPATSPAGVETNQNYALFGHPLLQQPTHGCLHWCSTETATTNPGHIEGALQAAERAVAAITDGSHGA